MAKPKKTLEEIIEALKTHFADLLAHITGGGAAPAKSKKSDDDDDDAGEADTDDDDDADEELPSVADVAKMGKEDVAKYCAALDIEIDGLKLAQQKAFLENAIRILTDDTDEVDEDDANALAEQVGVTPGKKLAKTIAALKEYLTSAAEGGEDDDDDDADDKAKGKKKPAADDDDDDDSDDDDNEDDKKKKSKSKSDEDDDDDDDADDADDKKKKKAKDDDDDDDTDDGQDRAEIAKSFEDFPEASDMQERIDAYNEAVDEKDEIEVEPKKLKTAYRKLVAKLVDSEGEVAEWGEAYVANGEGMCCGLPLEEHTIKGEDGQFGKCAVTGKIFKVEDDGSIEEYAPKKKKVFKK